MAPRNVILMAARSNTYVCGSLVVGIAGSNPAYDMDVLALVNVVCCQVEVSVVVQFLVQRSTIECGVSKISKPQE
jgi:hypothetical protein